MSVHVGIDVHRKRSQVAVVDQAGSVLKNRNAAVLSRYGRTVRRRQIIPRDAVPRVCH